MKHSNGFLNSVEPSIWTITDLDYGPLASNVVRGGTKCVKNSVQSNYLNDDHLGYGLLASVSYKIVFIS